MVRVENTFLLLSLFYLVELRKRSKGLLLYYAALSVKHFCSSAGAKDRIGSNND